MEETCCEKSTGLELLRFGVENLDSLLNDVTLSAEVLNSLMGICDRLNLLDWLLTK